ncbi:hypothetical protein HNR55_002798 [Acetobacter lovaniensis]|uniref:Uncharacterized protein n=1 Tax=Acetobacter lovaniensis TaxID=104100 RepID=A0A841QJ82_9PROT|nr:hypothetical protein [Acetobacter lovaniensis]
MQLGMKTPHDYSALCVIISNLNVEWKLQRDFFNTIRAGVYMTVAMNEDAPFLRG